MKSVYTLALVLSIVQYSYSQPFTKVVPGGNVGLFYSHNAWVDLDNDGDLDIIVNGAESTNVLRTVMYRNEGNDTFTYFNSEPFLPQYSESEFGFINLNGDNLIDVIMMGRQVGSDPDRRISQLKNNSAGFTDIGNIPGFGQADGYGTIAVGDVNNDGTQDVFLSGIYGYADGNVLLKAALFTVKNGVYTLTENEFVPVYIAASKFADFDNDEDLDLIVCGSDGVHPYQTTNIYYNDGTGHFTASEIQLEPVQNPSIDIADYDDDGDLDILMSGYDTNGETVTKVYYDAAATYHELPLPESINRTMSGSAKWADYDNDGDLDILITGMGEGDDPATTLAIYYNDGGLYYEVEDLDLEVLSLGQASWGDYDSDGDLDIMVTGATNSEDPELAGTSYILKNGSEVKNEAPGIPTRFAVSGMTENSVSLFWDRPEDDHTAQNSLTFNLSIKDAEGKYLLHPFSDDETGKRKLVEQGNMWVNFGWHINDLEDGTWLFKVQAIDGGFAGSEWTEEQTFYAGSPAAPTNLDLSYNEGKITLMWTDNSNNEETFVIERRIGDGEFSQLGEVVTNQKKYIDGDVAAEGVYQYRVYAKNPNSDSDFSNIASFIYVGLEDERIVTSFVYPNPVSKTAFITAKEMSNNIVPASFIDMKGVAHKKMVLEFNHDGEASIDTSELSAGLYLLRLEGSRSRIFKLVKE